MKSPLHILAAALLTACSPLVHEVQLDTGDIRAGETLIAKETATRLFQDVCIKTAPRFHAAPSNAASHGFRVSPETGTYYDSQRNVSFRIQTQGRPVCSMVFGSHDRPQLLAVYLAAATHPVAQHPKQTSRIGVDPFFGRTQVKLRHGQIMTFNPRVKDNGIQYYRAAITAK